MSLAILDEIVAARRADIARLGFGMGAEIPDGRSRKVVPFVAGKSAILEIKRASPSKGVIAPNLDAAQTALAYVDGGASAISVLTEKNYFHGSLDDLKAVAAAVGGRAAVLRKDFLLDEEEIDIAWKCGADAALLIARILDEETLARMAKRCERLGMTAFIELRVDEDLRKLSRVAREVDPRFVAVGVNSRDLADFSIDLLAPCAMLSEIRAILGEGARVVFESGVQSPRAARFVGSLGFAGMLLGEAAARNPAGARDLAGAFLRGEKNGGAEFWLSLARDLRERRKREDKRPLVKICGITRAEDAAKAASLGADFLGFVFYAKSPRAARAEAAREARKKIDGRGGKKPRLVGVVVGLESDESKAALSLVRDGTLDALQIHGVSCACDLPEGVPHYCAVNVSCADDLRIFDALAKAGEPRVLVDAKVAGEYGGTGARVGEEILDAVSRGNRLWLAGGVTPENVARIVERHRPELIDVASGVESAPGVKDGAKMERLFEAIGKSHGLNGGASWA